MPVGGHRIISHLQNKVATAHKVEVEELYVPGRRMRVDLFKEIIQFLVGLVA